jgi:uncharacterized coiled-coil protein SlyX
MMNGHEALSEATKSLLAAIKVEGKDLPSLTFAKISYFDKTIENLSTTLKELNVHIDKLERKITIVKHKILHNSFELEAINDTSIDLLLQKPPKVSRKNRAIEIATNSCLSLGISSTLLEVFKIDPTITSLVSLLQLLFVLIVSYGIVFAVKDSIIKQIVTTENITPYYRFKPDTKDTNSDRGALTPQVIQNSQVKSRTRAELQTQSLLMIFNNRLAMLPAGILFVLDFCFSLPGVWLSLPSNVHPLVRCSSILAVALFSYLNISNALVMASNQILRDLKRQEKIEIINQDKNSEITLLVERDYKLNLALSILEDKQEKLLDRAVELEDKIADLEEERLDIIRDLDFVDDDN